jgi:hypothetical protein
MMYAEDSVSSNLHLRPADNSGMSPIRIAAALRPWRIDRGSCDMHG